MKIPTIIYTFLIAFVVPLMAQFDYPYDPFDWVLYRQLGEITCITEGFSFFYIGTEHGGVIRIQRTGKNAEETLTTAQGLKSNHISAVHFDWVTGNLWVIAGNYIHSSHTRTGSWYITQIDEWGLPQNTVIRRMGSSANYLWIRTSSFYVKLDHITGIFLGTYIVPDENNIQWSSHARFPVFNQDQLNEFSLSDGWFINGVTALNPYGNSWRITTFHIGKEGDVVLGTEDGTIFIGDTILKLLNPLIIGLGNNDVQFIIKEKGMLIGGRANAYTRGFTYLEPHRGIIEIISFEEKINLDIGSYYCAVRSGDEIWYGGNGIIAVYNDRDDFWRNLDETRGFSGQVITDMVVDSNTVWIASSSGLTHLDQRTKRSIPFAFEKVFRNIFIYDIELIASMLWIATDYDLSIIDIDSERLLNFKQMGDKTQFSGLADLLSGFKVLETVGDELLISTRQGVWSYNYQTKSWLEIVDASVFSGREIRSLVRFENYIFMATNDGFIRYDIKNSFIRDYNYNFLGNIHDMIIDERYLWLGTTSGLIRFIWTKD